MSGSTIIKVIMTAIVGLVVTSFATMNEDIVINKVKIDHVQQGVIKMNQQIDEIHWFLIRKSKK